MKQVILFLATLFLLTFQTVTSCPTCIGILETDTPEFFSDEFYQPYAQAFEYDSEQLNATKGDDHEDENQKDTAGDDQYVHDIIE